MRIVSNALNDQVDLFLNLLKLIYEDIWATS